MPKKKSVKKAAQSFVERAAEYVDYCKSAESASMSDLHLTWAHELALVKLAADFEHLMLHALVGAINNDTRTLSDTTGIEFPQHLTDEVCEFLIVQNGYFNFQGRSGLIGLLRKFVPEAHYLVQAVKKPGYKASLDRLFALRNFAAHGSRQSKAAALKVIGGQRIASAGSWVKKQQRLDTIVASVSDLAREVESSAPY